MPKKKRTPKKAARIRPGPTKRSNPRRCNMCRATGKLKKTGNPCPMCKGNGYTGVQRNPGETVAAFKRRMHTTIEIRGHEEVIAEEEEEEEAEEQPGATNPRRRRRKRRNSPASDAAAQRSHYEKLHWGDPPTGPIEVDAPDYRDASAVLGKLVKVEYVASKNGKTYTWVHKHLTPPYLVVTKQGKLLIAEPKGKKCYIVTAAGIEG
jgi:hypothetical protein